MMIRSWLAAVMRGEGHGGPALATVQCDDLSEILAVANEEGVVALIHERLQNPALATLLPSELLGLFADAARRKAVASMFREAECRRILKRFDQEGIPVLLLKGTALAYSVYAAPFLRERADIDFLFPTLQVTKQASKVICETDYIQPEIPGDLAVYEMTCFRTRNSSTYLELDLHWGIGGEAVYADRFSFDELFLASIALPALAPTARGLGLVHAYLRNHASGSAYSERDG
ncbi:MAG: nucleotidyltransferase family protein [Holophagaceae bacterium]|nr:nucleotidyltransferase family protein [Holophagaceae bacterium]